MHIEMFDPASLRARAGNARTHSRAQLKQLKRSIEHFGFTNPVLVDEQDVILAGHGRVAAAKDLGLQSIPVVRLEGMSEADKRAYVLADNQLAMKAGWDRELLAGELHGLIDLGFDLDLTGFSPGEIDVHLTHASAADANLVLGAENDVPAARSHVVSKLGDAWALGRHRLVCGDARDPAAYSELMGAEKATAIFTDPPYNVRISGHVRTGNSHAEFCEASGEMTKTEFTQFLRGTLGAAASQCSDGAIAFVCMDWRHLDEMSAAADGIFSELKNLCVWTKTNGGMGSLYRSQHELIFVYKIGDGAHCNNVELGKNGRNRTNVWNYAGVNSFGADRAQALAMHPTVKPVALVEDAIKDVSRRNDIVLDAFGGSGTTLIAAERCGRRARLLELDPAYCDVIVRRYEDYTGKKAHCAKTGEEFQAREDLKERAA